MTTSTPRPIPFCKLSDPANYVACAWDLTLDTTGREHWVEFFKRHLNTLLAQGIESIDAGESVENAKARAERCRIEFYTAFDAFARRPNDFGRVTILTLDRWRDDLLRRYGFVDPFARMKNRENAAVVPLLAKLCREIDALDEPQQFNRLIAGIFAGNIFDMGADATAKKFLRGGPDFFKTRDDISPRPWLIDDYDRLADRLINGPRHRKVVFFIDNAGSDFVLGATPMMRWLARRGTQVVMAANTRPTLNDMTADDVRAWWPKMIQAEPSLAKLPIQIVATGTGEPLIDLMAIDPTLNTAAEDADLIVLEGMGRGVESNLDVSLSCDRLNIAMIKDTAVAARHGGKVYDLICQFRPIDPPAR